MTEHRLPQWIQGSTRSGKTQALIEQVCHQTTLLGAMPMGAMPMGAGSVLMLSAIGDNRLVLRDRLTQATQSKLAFQSTTPLGWMESEVLLFWSLMVQKLDLAAQFPVRLRPENEQELATLRWRSVLDEAIGRTGIAERVLVRRLLDLYQLAAFAEVPLEDIDRLLEAGLGSEPAELPLGETIAVSPLLLDWRRWCLERGLLNYGLMTELYGQVLLPDPRYQRQLQKRVSAVFADDVDEYPAVMQSFFTQLLEQGTALVCTFNPLGGVRQGLGADPKGMEDWLTQQQQGDRWCIINLPDRATNPATNPAIDSDLRTPDLRTPDLQTPKLQSQETRDLVLQLVEQPFFLPTPLPDCIQTLQTSTRAQLLRQTATTIAQAIHAGQIRAQEIAILAPGLDPISRYSLTQMLLGQGIRVNHLNEQRPLMSVPLVRALLTLLALVYPYLGRLVTRDAVAEMLAVLGSFDRHRIDPVRSGLLANFCFSPHPDIPKLLPSQVFPRWDRLGYEASHAYEAIRAWIETQQSQLEQRLIPSPIVLLDRAIQTFYLTHSRGGAPLLAEQIASLRELLDMVQHYSEVDRRLRQFDRPDMPPSAMVRSLILLLRSGAVTANPYPVKPIGTAQDSVMISTVFQYRLERVAHRWQFWLDAGSDRWLQGSDSLFAAPLFLSTWSGRRWMPDDLQQMHEQRLTRILKDLLSRADERVILCYSELASNGQEQLGALMPLVNGAVPIAEWQ